MKKKLDAGSELHELVASVEGVRVLMDMLANASTPDAETEQRLPRYSAALLNLIAARMKQFGQALDGGRDPGELVTHFNRSLGAGGTALRSWDSEKRAQDARRELRRVAVEQRSRRGR